MDMLKKWKRKLIRRCKSSKDKNNNQEICSSSSIVSSKTSLLPKSKSYPPWLTPSSPAPTRHATPGGCFSVCVGPERQRFLMKAKYANHPLFKMLLDDAKEQYEYTSEGPLLLPCSVDLFYKVLVEMEYETCSSSSSSISHVIIHPHCCGGVYGSYNLLTPSRLLKLNHF